MSPNRKHLTARLMALFGQMSKGMGSRPFEEWEDIDLTMPQLHTLGHLSRGEQRMGDLAASLGVTLPSVTSLVDRLVAKGLVERAHDERDRRVVTCRLTDRGHAVIERLWRARQSWMEQMADLLDIAELETVVGAMEIMASAAGKHRQTGPTVVAGQQTAHCPSENRSP